jgi:transcriptional regulator GlxA family with amidase domain
MKRRIGILAYDGMQALDLVGPAEAFAAVRGGTDETVEGWRSPAYAVVVIGLDGKRLVAETGLTLLADVTASTSMTFDTLIVPGGRSMREESTGRRAAAWVARHQGSIRRIASVCTGIYGLAPTGLLDGRRVTTHWRHARDLARRYPGLRVESDALFIKDGRFYTSAGITAGVDLALALIEEDHGPRVALSVAREFVVFLKRPGGQDQFSEPLQFQLQAADRFADLTAWMTGHLSADLAVATLAARTCLCRRQFSRVFKQIYGASPAAFVEELRLGEASRRLLSRRVNVDLVARSVGYRSVDVFRRAFERRFGVSPGSYRSRFATHATPRSGRPLGLPLLARSTWRPARRR